MKSNPKLWLYGPNWQGKRCEARTRRGTLCQRPGSKQNGRCKLHGARSTGPTTKAGIKRLVASRNIHGRFLKEKREELKQNASIGREIKVELKVIERWAIDQGHLERNWRKKLGP